MLHKPAWRNQADSLFNALKIKQILNGYRSRLAKALVEEELAYKDTVHEARRVMEVCNACRYCGGFCAVFPAMEQRRQFPDGDLEYLANLCHNCAGCFHACQYIPPHEFCLNLPKTFTDLRAHTYKKYTWPSAFAALFFRNGLTVSLFTAFSCLVILLLTWLFLGSGKLFAVYRGVGSFYQIISYRLMIGGGLVLFLAALFALGMGLVRFIRGMGLKSSFAFRPLPLLTAVRDVLTLRYLGGAGDGCNDVDDTFTHLRRWLHQAVFYGFASCVVSTTTAAIYDHLLHHPAPYVFFSLPVLSGVLGGVAIMVGTGGLFCLKLVRDPRPTVPGLMGMDIAFSAQLFLVSLSGLLVLVFRGTQAMGILLVLHLGLVTSLFLSAPYGKFVHALYRFVALVFYAAEGDNEEQ